MNTMKPVKVYNAKDRIEAEMLLEALKRNNISAYKQGKESGGYLDIYAGNSIYGEDIYVDAQDATRAQEIITEIQSPVPKTPEGVTEDKEFESYKCSQTKKKTVSQIVILIFAILMILFVIGTIILGMF